VDYRFLRRGDEHDVLDTGNPSPSNRGEGRAGDNLYSNSLLALDVDTGKLKWYFQFTKHDEHDYDATQIPVLLERDGKHLLVQANRKRIFLRAGPEQWQINFLQRLRESDLEQQQGF